MKKTVTICCYVFISACILCATFWSGQNNTASTDSEIKTYVFEAECTIDGKLTSKNLFDERGNLTDKIKYDENGKESSHNFWRYSKNNEVLEEGAYQEGNLALEKTHTYNAEGKLLSTWEHRPDGSKKLLIQNTYDAKGNLIEKLDYETYDNKVLRTVYQYTDDGKVAEHTNYTDGIEGTKCVYQYDSNGKQVKRALYKNGICFRAWETEYDEQGRNIKNSRFENGVIYAYGEKKYDSFGNLIEETSVTVGEKNSRVVWEYDIDGNMLYNAKYKNGVETARTEKKFDKNGNNTETKQYTNGLLVSYEVNTYGVLKLIKSEIVTYEEGQENSRTVKAYNSNEKVMEVTRKYKSGDVHCDEYVYNKKGLLVTQYEYYNGELASTYNYEYDKNGYIIRKAYSSKKYGDKIDLYKCDDDGNIIEHEYKNYEGSTVVVKYAVLKIPKEKADFIDKELNGEIMY